VVDHSLRDENTDSLADISGVGPIELDAPGIFILSESREFQRLFSSLDQRTCCDHFRNAQPGAESTAQPPKRIVADTGHRGKDGRGIDRQFSENEGRIHARSGSGGIVMGPLRCRNMILGEIFHVTPRVSMTNRIAHLR